MIRTQEEVMDLPSQLNSIPEAIEDIKAGKVIIVVDDEDRENEGDFICAAECVTPEIINFMATCFCTQREYVTRSCIVFSFDCRIN